MPIPGRHVRALFCFRRDLRDYDNAGLCRALESSRKVFCAFIFDRENLDELPSSADRRVEIIWESIDELRTVLENLGDGLMVRHARSSEAIPRLAAELKVNAVFANDDYEPLAIARDRRVEHALSGAGIAFHRHKDTVIFEKDEVLTQAGRPYSVFTPYKNALLKKLNAQGDFHVRPYPVENFARRLAKPTGRPANADTRIHGL
jgi:deoxyribodipyrimidine photo-lyase